MDCCKTKLRSEDEKKEYINRINRIIGQMNGIKNMVIDDRYCNDIIIQLSAIDKSIKSLANLMIEKHMHTCVINDIKNGDNEIVDEVIDLFKRFQ